MARASIPTLLSPNRWARLLGLDPMHFSQGVSTIRVPSSCSQVWYQHDWQNLDNISRESVANAIDGAEHDLADAIGYWPASRYTVDEFHQYPGPAAPGYYGTGANIKGQYKSIRLNRGWVIEGGQRAVEYLGTFCWVALDADGDGFTEIAHFQVTGVSTSIDVCQVKAYFKEYDSSDAENSRTDLASSAADPAWEVRPFRVELVGTTLNAYFWVWDLFRPQLQEELGPDVIDADDFGDGPPEDPCDYLALTALGSYVDELMFYREYTDTEDQVQFLWGPDITCSSVSACTNSTQAGCIRVKDRRNGLVIPQPGTYNNGAFTAVSWTNNVEPDAIRIWYRSGWTPENQRNCVVLDDKWARVIAMLATSRLEWDLCDCSNARETSHFWRQDAAQMTTEKSFNLRPDELSNPFGQRVGEVMAWRQIRNRGRRVGRAVKA